MAVGPPRMKTVFTSKPSAAKKPNSWATTSGKVPLKVGVLAAKLTGLASTPRGRINKAMIERFRAKIRWKLILWRLNTLERTESQETKATLLADWNNTVLKAGRQNGKARSCNAKGSEVSIEPLETTHEGLSFEWRRTTATLLRINHCDRRDFDQHARASES